MAEENDTQKPDSSPLRSMHLTVGDLRKAIEGLPDDLEIYCQAGNNDLGNIWGPHALDKATYGFFGSRIPCLLINHSRSVSEMGILWRVGLPEDDEENAESDDDEMLREAVARCWNTGKMVIGNRDDKGNVIMSEHEIEHNANTEPVE